MKAWLSLLALSLMLTACGEPPPAVGPATTAGNPATTAADPGDAVTVRVFQEQRTCCYTEGQVSFFSVNGVDYEIRPSRIGLIPLIEVHVPTGSIEVESWQQPCSGNCGFLDPPANQCSMAIDATSPQTLHLLVSFEPGPDPCELNMLQEDPATSVPLDFGFRSPLPSCGEDFTMQMALFGEGIQESPERQCFVDAHLSGAPAELSAYEPPDPNAETDDVLDLIHYRTQPDQAVEVIVNVGPEFEEWHSYRCELLREIDGPALFALEQCTEPQLLE